MDVVILPLFLDDGTISKLELPHRACIPVRTDLSALAQVLSWFDQFSHPPVNHAVWLQCQLILAEGFTNAVRHAHHDKPADTPIDIEVVLHSDRIEIRIWDSGQPFDLEKKLQSIPDEVDKNAEGGRGLRLIKKMADDFRYRRTDDGRNCFYVTKYYPPTESIPPLEPTETTPSQFDNSLLKDQSPSDE